MTIGLKYDPELIDIKLPSSNSTRPTGGEIEYTPKDTSIGIPDYVADGFATGIGGAGKAIAGLNNYSVEEAGLPFQMPSNISRRDRGRVQRLVDKYNDEWQAQQDEKRALINETKDRRQEEWKQATSYENKSSDLTRRLNSVLRIANKKNSDNASLQEAADRVTAGGDTNTLEMMKARMKEMG